MILATYYSCPVSCKGKEEELFRSCSPWQLQPAVHTLPYRSKSTVEAAPSLAGLSGAAGCNPGLQVLEEHQFLPLNECSKAEVLPQTVQQAKQWHILCLSILTLPGSTVLLRHESDML